jgi:hypothetical protein
MRLGEAVQLVEHRARVGRSSNVTIAAMSAAPLACIAVTQRSPIRLLPMNTTRRDAPTRR